MVTRKIKHFISISLLLIALLFGLTSCPNGNGSMIDWDAFPDIKSSWSTDGRWILYVTPGLSLNLFSWDTREHTNLPNPYNAEDISFISSVKFVIEAREFFISRIDSTEDCVEHSLGFGGMEPDVYNAEILLFSSYNNMIYIYNFTTEELASLNVEGRHPSWNVEGNKFVFSYDNRLYIHDLTSDSTQLVDGVSDIASWPSWSPDGRYITYVNGPTDYNYVNDVPQYDIFLYDLTAGENQRLCSGHRPSWGPDGTKLLFSKGDWYGTVFRLYYPNLFVYDLISGEITQLTDYKG